MKLKTFIDLADDFGGSGACKIGIVLCSIGLFIITYIAAL